MITAVRTAAISSLIFLALPSCEEGEGFPSLTSKPASETSSVEGRSGQTVVKDVERPDVFNVTETGLWDGRPSLGGVWVAHPDVKEPERVIITNTSNGETVPGALFRRERDNPGPRIQVSSEAAAALSMIAGKPVELSIIAVRQETVEVEPEPLPISEEGTEETTESEAEAATVDDSNAGEAAVVGAVAASEAKPKRRGFWQSLREGFRKKPAGEIAEEADAAAVAATVDDASAPEVETQSLDPVATTAAAAIAEAEADDKPAPRPSKPASSLKNPYVQVGIFSVEANATSAAASLRQSGIVPTVLKESANGELYWRVVVGPVTTADDQAAVLSQVRRLGYSDAFLSPN